MGVTAKAIHNEPQHLGTTFTWLLGVGTVTVLSSQLFASPLQKVEAPGAFLEDADSKSPSLGRGARR